MKKNPPWKSGKCRDPKLLAKLFSFDDRITGFEWISTFFGNVFIHFSLHFSLHFSPSLFTSLICQNPIHFFKNLRRIHCAVLSGWRLVRLAFANFFFPTKGNWHHPRDHPTAHRKYGRIPFKKPCRDTPHQSYAAKQGSRRPLNS